MLLRARTFEKPGLFKGAFKGSYTGLQFTVLEAYIIRGPNIRRLKKNNRLGISRAKAYVWDVFLDPGTRFAAEDLIFALRLECF